MIIEEVKVKKDNGKKAQWNIGRFIYRQDGGKRRLNTRLLNWLGGALFIFVLLIALFKDGASYDANEQSSIPAASSAMQTGTIDIKILDAHEDSNTADSTEYGNPVKSDSKRAFSNFPGLEKIERRTEVGIPPGAMVKARLMSGASDGPVRAVLEESLIVNGSTLVKEGSVLVGTGSSTEERLMIAFSQVVFADGTHQRIEAQACDAEDKMPGLKGSNVRGQTLKLAGAIGLGLVGGTALGLQRKRNETQDDKEEPTLKDGLLNGVAEASLEQARQTASDIKETKPLIEVAEGEEFYVLFAGGEK